MPLFRRIPKRGFKNINTKNIIAINVSELERFENGTEVTVDTLLENGVISKTGDGVKILGNGELTKKLDVKVNAFSASAKEKIEALGGKAEVI
jgi:large subunit ribosomal protein L15